MTESSYGYSLVLSKLDGTRLETVSVDVDWEPARQWAWFAGLRRGQLKGSERIRASSVRPLWHSELGEPFASGFRVCLDTDGEQTSTDFGMTPRRDSSRLCLSTHLIG